MRSLPVTLRAVLYVTGFLLFFPLVALRIRTLDRVFLVALPDGVGILGVVLMVGGGVLGLACVGTFIVRG